MKYNRYPKRDAIKDYFPLPNEVFYLGLSYGEIAVYSYLLYRKNRKNFQCYPSYKTIGKALKMSRNTVCKYIRQLEEKELITTEPTSVHTSKGGKRNGNLLYTILPIEQAKKHFHDWQLENLERTLAEEKQRKRIEKLNLKPDKPIEKINSEMPFGEWIDLWYRTYCKHTIRTTTQLEYENRIYKHIIPEIGAIPLNQLTQSDLQQFYAKEKTNGRKIRVNVYGTGLSDRVIRAIHANCRSALEKAVQERLIRVNPAIGCKLPPKKSQEMKVLTQNEVIRFLNRAKEEGYYELFLLELGTGMRRGEILALKWGDLNFTTGELRIERQINVIHGETIISVPKTKSSIRTVVLPLALLKILSEYKRNVESEWIFPSPLDNSKTRNPSAVQKRMQIILERAGCKKVRFHDLRHTFSVMALENGMGIKSLSSMLGHVSSATTIDIYSHITNTMQRQAAAKIDCQICSADAEIPQAEERVRTDTDTTPPDFEPYKPKVRKSGTGCVTMINDHLYEGRFTPTNAYGKREAHNIYAKTREECEEKLAELIVQVKADIKAKKERLKTMNESFTLEVR